MFDNDKPIIVILLLEEVKARNQRSIERRNMEKTSRCWLIENKRKCRLCAKREGSLKHYTEGCGGVRRLRGTLVGVKGGYYEETVNCRRELGKEKGAIK